MATFSGRQRRCWRGRGLTGPLHPTGLKRVQALPDSRNGQGCGPRTSQGPVAEDPPHHRHIGSRERAPHGATADGGREGARHFADAVLLAARVGSGVRRSAEDLFAGSVSLIRPGTAVHRRGAPAASSAALLAFSIISASTFCTSSIKTEPRPRTPQHGIPAPAFVSSPLRAQ